MPLRTAFVPLLYSLVACLALFGCTAQGKPVVWVDREVSFADYRALEVQPIFNATGRPLEDGILSSLTALLMEQLEAKNLPITSSPGITSGILVVRSELVVYEAYMPATVLRSTGPVGWGEAKCTLRTRLIDKSRNRAVAEIVSVKIASAGSVYEVPFGGASTVNAWGSGKVLKDVAIAVAEDVATLMVTREHKVLP